MRRMLKFRPQRGDTIVEVMLAMAVVGLVLGVAYGITNRSVAVGRSAQERSEALKIAETQLELLKEYVDEEDRTPGQSVTDKLLEDLRINGGSVSSATDSACFGLDPSNNVIINKVENTIATDGDACEFNGLYQVTTVCLSGVPNDNSSLIAKTQTCTSSSPAALANRKIIVRVTWERLGAGLRDDGSGNLEPARDSVDLYYRYGD